MGFQDFLIDSIAHSKSPKPPTVKTEDRVKKIIIDPMSSIIVPPVSAAISHDPIINIS